MAGFAPPSGDDMSDYRMTRISRLRARAAGTALLASVAAAAILLPAAPAAAQASDAITIPAQPLDRALIAFMDATGYEIVYPADLSRGRQSSAVANASSPAAALSQLLGGTGLTFRQTGPRRFTLEPSPTAEAGTIELGPVRVEGEAGTASASGALPRTLQPETAAGPVNGYVAKRTATGSKSDTPLIEIPQAISVVTADQIEAQAAQTLEQAVLYSPGATVGSNGPSTEHDFVFTRGFTARQFLDGTQLYASYITGAQLRLETYGLERIEILKGPSSGLYGQIEPGGLVNLVTKRPAADMINEARLQIGSFNRYQGSFDVGGAIDADGTLLVRLTGLARESDTQSDYMKDSRRFIAPAVTWKPDDRTTLTILGHYQHDDGGGRAQPLPPAGTIDPNPNGKVPLNRFMGEPDFDGMKRDQYRIGYFFEHRFSDGFALRQNLSYARAKVHENFSYTDFFGTFLTDLRTVDRTAWDDRNAIDIWTVDNQVEGRFDTGAARHKLLVGFDARWVKDDWTFSSAPMATLDVFNPVYGQPIGDFTTYILQREKDRQFGLYAQDQIAMDRLRVTLGGRYDWTRGETDDLIYGTNTVQENNAFTGHIGLTWLFDNGIAPYASFSTSFEPAIGTDADGVPFKPSRGRQWELGFKYEPKSFNGFFSVAVFDLTETNVLTADPNPPASNPYAQVQTGESRSRGIEAEAKVMLTAGLNLLASYAYLDTEITKSNDTNLGRHITYTPAHQASLWLDYAPHEGSLAGLRIGGGVRYRGTMDGLYYDYRLPANTLVDGLIGYDLGRLSSGLSGLDLAVNARNIFDRKFITNCNTSDGCVYGERRTVLGTLRYRW